MEHRQHHSACASCPQHPIGPGADPVSASAVASNDPAHRTNPSLGEHVAHACTPLWSGWCGHSDNFKQPCVPQGAHCSSSAHPKSPKPGLSLDALKQPSCFMPASPPQPAHSHWLLHPSPWSLMVFWFSSTSRLASQAPCYLRPLLYALSESLLHCPNISASTLEVKAKVMLCEQKCGTNLPWMYIQVQPTYVKVEVCGTFVGSSTLTSLLEAQSWWEVTAAECGENFSSARALQLHEQMHTRERPFVCSIHSGALTTRHNLKVHYITHWASNNSVCQGRQLNTENTVTVLDGKGKRMSEMFPKELLWAWNLWCGTSTSATSMAV